VGVYNTDVERISGRQICRFKGSRPTDSLDPGWPPARRTLVVMARTPLQRLHNPRNRSCGCDPDCWCRSSALGRAVKWWFPARYFGLHHKNPRNADWKREMGESS
jgi:hypothetical protein